MKYSMRPIQQIERNYQLSHNNQAALL